MDKLTKGLSPAEAQELQNILDYISEKIATNAPLAEGNIGTLLNRASPNVRQRFQMISEFMETPRTMPFQPKFDERDRADFLGLDPDEAEQGKAALDALEVSGKLQQRMGTDAQRPKAPLTLREQVAAALEAANTPRGN